MHENLSRGSQEEKKAWSILLFNQCQRCSCSRVGVERCHASEDVCVGEGGCKRTDNGVTDTFAGLPVGYLSFFCLLWTNLKKAFQYFSVLFLFILDFCLAKFILFYFFWIWQPCTFVKMNENLFLFVSFVGKRTNVMFGVNLSDTKFKWNCGRWILNFAFYTVSNKVTLMLNMNIYLYPDLLKTYYCNKVRMSAELP